MHNKTALADLNRADGTFATMLQQSLAGKLAISNEAQ
jgi:hypothetical protein